MENKTLFISEIVRCPQQGPEDKLSFTHGVNLIVGPGNSGKTKWLNMLDFLMGDPGKPEESFPIELVEKYDSVGACFFIGEESFFIERRWKEKGAKGKVFVDGEGKDTEEFQDFLMEHLNVPILHFAKGNPYEERAWPKLSWRTLLRHIYRQQRFWSDIADKQTESEQLASIMQFLGIAEHLFSEKSGILVEKRKELWKAKVAKEQYLKLLDQISRELADEEEIQVTVTNISLEQAIENINEKIKGLQNERSEVLTQLQNRALEQTENSNANINDISVKWADLQKQYTENASQLSNLEKRLSELEKYRLALDNELAKE